MTGRWHPRLFHVHPRIVRALVDSGLSDPKIAKRFGVTTPSVWFYRKKHRIPTNRDRRLAQIPREVIEWLVERRLTDGEIGRIFKVSAAAVCQRRFKQAIASPRARNGGWAA